MFKIKRAFSHLIFSAFVFVSLLALLFDASRKESYKPPIVITRREWDSTTNSTANSSATDSESIPFSKELLDDIGVPIAPVLTLRLRQLYAPEVCIWETERCRVFSENDQRKMIEGFSQLTNSDYLKKWTVWNEMESSFLIKKNAVINSLGDVRACEETNVLIGSYGCKDYIDSVPECQGSYETHKNVIVISQHWGEGYFHAMIEGLPRLMQGVEFLGSEALRHWSVHSLMPSTAQVADLLGLKSAVSGAIRAETVFIPRPTACGGELNGKWVRRIRPRFVGLNDFLLNASTRRMIICKRGEGSVRALTNHQDIVQTVRALWKGEVLEHTGRGSFADQMRLFAVAHGILGPHGAGLSNMVFMPSGSVVVEVLPTMGSNRLNPCYIVLAYTLRHRYFGLHGEFDASSQGSLDVSLLDSLPIWF